MLIKTRFALRQERVNLCLSQHLVDVETFSLYISRMSFIYRNIIKYEYMQFQIKSEKKMVNMLRFFDVRRRGGGAYIQTRNLLFEYMSPYACGGGGGGVE